MTISGLQSVAALSTLDDPVRRRLYDYVCRRGSPMSREEAAKGAGIGRPLAAYHLDKLAEEGLLSVTYERRSGRRGPGAGRPAKLYVRSDREISASVPPRDYGLAARLLAEAAASDVTGTTARALADAAQRLGRELAQDAGEPSAGIAEALGERGYEPYDDDGVLRLRNCPFHAAAQRHPEVVCAMNVALIGGLLDGFGADDVSAELDPAPGRCCVAIRRGPPEQSRDRQAL